MFIDSGFGTREVPVATISVTVGGRERSVIVELRSDVKDRDEDGLVPTSFFRSVFVSTADGVVVFDARMPCQTPRNVGGLQCSEVGS